MQDTMVFAIAFSHLSKRNNHPSCSRRGCLWVFALRAASTNLRGTAITVRCVKRWTVFASLCWEILEPRWMRQRAWLEHGSSSLYSESEWLRCHSLLKRLFLIFLAKFSAGHQAWPTIQAAIVAGCYSSIDICTAGIFSQKSELIVFAVKCHFGRSDALWSGRPARSTRVIRI